MRSARVRTPFAPPCRQASSPRTCFARGARLCLLLAAVAGMRSALQAADAPALVRLTIKEDADRTVVVEGKIVVEAVDGGILLLARDGRLWTCPPRKLAKREPTDRPFSRFRADELAHALAEEFGPSFEIVRTRHYVIATSTGPHYAQWCGDLFERLLEAFLAHWKNLGVELSEPEWPLPAVVFANEAAFKAHAIADAGPLAESSKGYYSIRTNRMVLYDLTSGRGKKHASSAAEVKRATGAAAFNVATIVHEATHQIAFNSGMHTRFADNPLWLTEGMAMYFETPDLDGTRGWKTIGEVSRLRRDRFLEFARRRRKHDSIATLVSRPERFTDPRRAADAYAESWALTYYLLQNHPRAYVAYLKGMARKSPLDWDDESRRLAEFKSAFGDDLKSLDADFLKYVRSLPR